MILLLLLERSHPLKPRPLITYIHTSETW